MNDTRRAILVGAGEERHLDELARLADTIGMEVCGRLEQNRRNGTGYLGRGKRESLARVVEELEVGFVVTDDELTASQARVLEKDAGASVVDRAELIIRIFESHARDAASRLEVELADLEYRLPRVKGRNEALSRLGGGVGTRGPGEQQLEYDRRAIRRRMEVINRKLEEEKAARAVRGARLKEDGPPIVALVGYTNAGKTTILNSITGACRSTRDWLFETLETTTRLVPGTDGTGNGSHGAAKPDFAITDTVGFIRKLPTQLVHSFASTLETARDAEVTVLCADASSATLEEEIQTVRRTLGDILSEEHGRETILCLNKIDLIPRDRIVELHREYPGAVMLSAVEDTEKLVRAIHEAISEGRKRMELLIPHAEYGAVSRLYGKAEIHASRNTNTGLWLDVTLPESTTGKYYHYRVS